jgi:hypothetical protein
MKFQHLHKYDKDPINKSYHLFSLSPNSSRNKQLVVDSVVIDAEFSRENYGSIPSNCDQKVAGTT